MEWAAGAGCGLRAFSTGKGTATSFVTTCGEEHGRGEAMDRVQLEERGISCNNEITNNKTGTLFGVNEGRRSVKKIRIIDRQSFTQI